jgi:hypothetical protein
MTVVEHLGDIDTPTHPPSIDEARPDDVKPFYELGPARPRLRHHILAGVDALLERLDFSVPGAALPRVRNGVPDFSRGGDRPDLAHGATASIVARQLNLQALNAAPLKIELRPGISAVVRELCGNAEGKLKIAAAA